MERMNTGRTSSPKSSSSATSMTTAKFTDLVRKKAYELYQKRGCKTGHSMEDWLEAERLVKQETRRST